MTSNKFLQTTQFHKVSASAQIEVRVTGKTQEAKLLPVAVYRTDGSMITRTYRRRR